LLPKASKIKTVEHHDALAYQVLPAFMADLSARDYVRNNDKNLASLDERRRRGTRRFQKARVWRGVLAAILPAA
jgi:hypothetical protein